MSRTTIYALVLLAVSLSIITTSANAQPTSFTYQGSLNDNGGLADGIYDFEFNLFAAASGGASLGTSTSSTVDVVGGIFSVQLDFGAMAFDGSRLYLEIGTRFNGDPAFTTLTPRVPIDSVPYATHAAEADFAYYAADGPFAPFDNTPQSGNGAGPQQLFATLTIPSNGQFTNVDLNYPITISRPAINSQNDMFDGDYLNFQIEVSRPMVPNSTWISSYTQQISQISIELQIAGIPNQNLTTFLFQNGTVTGHRLDQNGPTLLEVLEVSFGPAPAPQQVPLSTFVTRTASSFTENGPGPFAPSLGGTSVRADSFTLSYDGFTPPYSSVGAFPIERRFFNPLPNNERSQSEPLLMLHNVFADRFNTMWDHFSIADGLDATERISISDNGTMIWQPPLNPTGGATVTQWQLRMAGDGGLFETYQIEYVADPVSP